MDVPPSTAPYDVNVPLIPAVREASGVWLLDLESLVEEYAMCSARMTEYSDSTACGEEDHAVLEAVLFLKKSSTPATS